MSGEFGLAVELFPNKINLYKGANFVLSDLDNQSVRYITGDVEPVSQKFVDLSYFFESSDLIIYSIFNGRFNYKVPDLTCRTIGSMASVFDIESVCFDSVSEPRTSDLIMNFHKNEFNLEELIGFENSPFLRSLKQFGFNYIKTNMANGCELAKSDNDKFVRGYR